MDKRKSQDNWDVEALAEAYMEVREGMWQILASKLSQNWQAMEGKVNWQAVEGKVNHVFIPSLFSRSICFTRRICTRHHHVVEVATGLETSFKWCGSCNERICWLYPTCMCMIVAQSTPGN